MARDCHCRSSLGHTGPQRDRVRDHRGAAYASSKRIHAWVRGLVVSLSAALRRVCNASCIGVRGSLPCGRGAVWRWGGGAAVALHRHSQRLGRRHIPRLGQETGTARSWGASLRGHLSLQANPSAHSESRDSLLAPYPQTLVGTSHNRCWSYLTNRLDRMYLRNCVCMYVLSAPQPPKTTIQTTIVIWITPTARSFKIENPLC